MLYLCYRYLTLSGGASLVGAGEDVFIKQHEDASLFCGSGGPVPPLDQLSASAFEAALLANANLCGDNVNRGMLIGGILGLAFGFHNIPARLVDGLYRAGELKSNVTTFIGRVVQPQLAAIRSGMAMPSRFGRPEPFCRLPRLPYPACGFGAPQDLRHKLALVKGAKDKGAAAARDKDARVRFLKASGAILLPASGSTSGSSSSVATKLSAGEGAAAISRKAALDLDGDAVKDRELFLQNQAPGGSSSTSSSVATAAAASSFVPLKDLHSSLLDEELAVNLLLDAGDSDKAKRAPLGVEVAAGTGVFFYPGQELPAIEEDKDGEAEPWREILRQAFDEAATKFGKKA